MEWLKDRNRESLLNISATDNMSEEEAKAVSAYMCLFYHLESPLVRTVKDREQRMLKALGESGVSETVADMIVNNGRGFGYMLNRWFHEYNNDDATYYNTLCIKIDQLNGILRENMSMSEMTADDKAKTIKWSCDASLQLDDLYVKKKEVEKRLFANDTSSADQLKKAAANALSPEAQAGFNKYEE